MSNITPFKFDNHNVRVISDENGEPLFVGKDICDALGYKDQNAAMRDHCKGVRKSHPLQTGGGVQELRVISEPDMMRLIVNSTLPAAQEFERLVFEEILPTIRKTGSYSVTKAKPEEPRASIRYKEAESIMRSHLKMCKMLGVSENMAKVVTAKQVKMETGLDCTPLLAGVTVSEDVPVTPTALADFMGAGFTAAKINSALIATGLQTYVTKVSRKTGKTSKVYEVTEAGKAYGEMEPFQSDFSDHVGYRVMWFKRVADVIRSTIDNSSNVIALVGSTT